MTIGHPAREHPEIWAEGGEEKKKGRDDGGGECDLWESVVWEITRGMIVPFSFKATLERGGKDVGSVTRASGKDGTQTCSVRRGGSKAGKPGGNH